MTFACWLAAQLELETGAHRLLYRDWPMRQVWFRGHCELEPQVQRPLVPAGALLQPLVTDTDWQLRPPAHPELQPPQWVSLLVMSTALPPQHTWAALPHRVPLLLLAQVPVLHCTQLPEQEVLQQMPPTQKPDAQTELPEHALPFAFFTVHTPPEQM